MANTIEKLSNTTFRVLLDALAGAASVTIRADGLLAGVRRVYSEVRTSFVVGRRLVVRITLLSRCVGVVCGRSRPCWPKYRTFSAA